MNTSRKEVQAMAFDVTAVLKANVSNFTSGIKEAQSVFESFQSK